ncbi:hypothetical protein JP75_07700 [Devosia riboflavina]|uniref:Methyltransferase n=1 Tax=Devosia riboflavina TaxID=46914 RepID=A0A087M3H8_9HYPH|nr:SAM-dependent methyltransferase [Devosia riboflavina]KFL31431.1 hypothetical protein JP75_07700 [Devosia riboflavina]
MAQNTSSAVMQQRLDHGDKLNYFPTPLWATRALIRWIIENIGPVEGLTCLEPACGQGHMARALAEFFQSVSASDLVDRGYGTQADFLFPDDTSEFDWIITNPPFSLAEEFILRALLRARVGVAMLVRTAFIEGEGRYLKLFRPAPPRAFLQFVERVPMFKGVVRNPAELYWDEEAQKWRRPSSATAYSWVVWVKDHDGRPELAWIPPSRRKLERPGDYEVTP